MIDTTERLSRLTETGIAVHGRDWQCAMARSLGVSARLMRRWVARDRPVPAWVDDRIPGVLAEAASAFQGRAAALGQMAGDFQTGGR